jgi:YVTN family beta-propeller protein
VRGDTISAVGVNFSRRRLLSAAVLAGCARKARGFPGYAFVANQDGRSVAAVNLRRFVLARQIPLEAGPTAVIAHPTRPVAYVLTPESGTIYEIEAAGIKRRTRPAQSALAMRLAGDGSALWVLGREPRALIRVPLDTLKPAESIHLAQEPADFELDRRREGQMAAVSFPRERSVALIPLEAKAIPATIPFSTAPRIVGFRSDGKQLAVACSADRTMTMLDTASGRTVVRLPLPLEPTHFCFLPDGGQLFVTGPGMDAVVIVSPYSTEVTETILAGRAPAQMAVLNSPQYLFVSNPESGDVTVLDIETRKLVVVIHAGAEPRQILFTPDNQYALVLNSGSGDLAVIRIAEFTTGPNSEWAQRYKHGGLFTVLPVGARPVGAAVVRV